jgi:hypothetical protein
MIVRGKALQAGAERTAVFPPLEPRRARTRRSSATVGHEHPEEERDQQKRCRRARQSRSFTTG